LWKGDSESARKM